jgi:hypothetical protein
MREGGFAGMSADGSEQVVELDGGEVTEGGLEAEVVSGRGHEGAVVIDVFRERRASLQVITGKQA